MFFSFLLLSVFLAVVEICLIFEVEFFEMFDNGIIKTILLEVAHFGACVDLEITSGILTIIAGVIWLVITIVLMVSINIENF